MSISYRMPIPLGALVALCLMSGLAQAQSNPINPPYLNPIYSEVIPTSAGLPYNPDTDTQETFTAPNGKTVTVLVKGPQGTGTFTAPPLGTNGAPAVPDDYFPWAINAAVAAGDHRLVIPKDNYNFHGPKMIMGDKAGPSDCAVQQNTNCASTLLIGPGLQDLEIDGSGATLNFNAPATAISIVNATRVRLKNFIINWPWTPVAALGTIRPDPFNPGHNALVINPDYNVTAVNPAFTMNGYPSIQAVDLWDGGNTVENPGHFDNTAAYTEAAEVYFIFNVPQPTYVGNTAAGEQTYSCRSCGFVDSKNPADCNYTNGCANFDYYALGTQVIVRYYVYNGLAFYVSYSDDIDLDNITILSSPGMAINVNAN